jgi:hypothetical protein
MEKEIETKEILNWQRLAITIGIVLVTAAAVGGTVWYLMDQNAQNIADSNAKSISEIQKQVDELKSSKVTNTVADSNSKTYSNSKFGISFSYPKAWTLSSDNADGPSFTVNGTDKFAITIMKDLPGGRGYEAVRNFTRYDGTVVKDGSIVLGTKVSSQNDTIEGDGGVQTPTNGYAITATTDNNFNGYSFFFQMTGDSSVDNSASVVEFENLVKSIKLK